MSADHAPQPALRRAGSGAVALCEFDVVRGADIDDLRRALGPVLDRGATLGLSSSLLGTLDPLAMPGGFRPFDLRQPDLLVWLDGPDPAACRSAAGSLADDVDGLLARRRQAIGTAVAVPAPPVPAPPVIEDGPGRGGTYVVLVAAPDHPLDGPGGLVGGDLVVEPDPEDDGTATAPMAVLVRADLTVLAGLDGRAVDHGGLYLLPDLPTARRLTAARV